MSESVWEQIGTEIESFMEEIRELPVTRSVTPEAIRAELEKRYAFEAPVPLEDLVADVTRLLRAGTVHVTHPRYFGLFNPSVRRAGIAGDTLAALYNLQLAVWSHAPVAQEIERLTLRTFTDALGMEPADVIANYTTGGAEANLSAVLAALAHHFPDMDRTGVAGLPARPGIYLTAESHHSFAKIVRMTGLGLDAVREVETTDRFVMASDALRRRLRADVERGIHPLLVVGTAGTTSTGAVDPLPELADAAAEAGAWFHVDAAWGGSAVLSSRLKPALAGIERADSITWDAHKWLSVPMGAGMFFCRRPEAVRRAFSISTSYMPAGSGDDTEDPYAVTAQWSRRAIGLKVFLSIAEAGLDGYGEMIERQARMGDLLRDRLTGAGWTLTNETPLPVVCFSHSDIRAGAVSTEDVLATIHERGRVWISDVSPGGNERMLRACITSFRTNEEDLDRLLEELEHARRRGAE